MMLVSLLLFVKVYGIFGLHCYVFAMGFEGRLFPKEMCLLYAFERGMWKGNCNLSLFGFIAVLQNYPQK